MHAFNASTMTPLRESIYYKSLIHEYNTFCINVTVKDEIQVKKQSH